jgi:hypothetical protein
LVAQGPRPAVRAIEDVLPASVYCVQQFGGLEACRQGAAQSPLAPLVQQFLGRLPAEVREQRLEAHLEDLAGQLQQGLQQVGIRPADLQAVLRQPIAMAIGRLSIEGLGPSMALLIDEGEAAAAIRRTCNALMQQLPQLGIETRIAAATIDGLAVQQVTTATGVPLFLGSLGGVFVLTNSRGLLRECIAVANGQQPSLAASTRLGALRGKQAGPALLSTFYNLRSITQMLVPHLPYEAEQFGAALGIGALDDGYVALGADQAGGSDRFQLGLQGSRTGLLKALVQAPCELSFARACSPNTVAFAAGSIDAPAVADAFLRFAELLPAEFRDEMMRDLRRDLARACRDMGTSPTEVDTVLRAFGNQVGVAFALEKGPVPKPELLLRLSVRDAAVVTPLLQRLEAAVAREAGVEWKTRKVGAHELRFCNLPLPGDGLQLSPSYVLADGALWLGSDTMGLVRAIKRLDATEPVEALSGQADFATAAARADGASGMVHLRLSRAAEIGWPTIESMVYPQLDARRDEVGFDSDALPDAEAVAKALGCTTFLYRVDDTGVQVEGYGTLTFGAAMAAFGSLTDSLLTRAGGKVY